MADRLWSKRVLWLLAMAPEEIGSLHFAELDSKFWPCVCLPPARPPSRAPLTATADTLSSELLVLKGPRLQRSQCPRECGHGDAVTC